MRFKLILDTNEHVVSNNILLFLTKLNSCEEKHHLYFIKTRLQFRLLQLISSVTEVESYERHRERGGALYLSIRTIMTMTVIDVIYHK